MNFFRRVGKLIRKFEDEAMAIAYAEAGEIESAREIFEEIDKKERSDRKSEGVPMSIKPLEERS